MVACTNTGDAMNWNDDAKAQEEETELGLEDLNDADLMNIVGGSESSLA